MGRPSRFSPEVRERAVPDGRRASRGPRVGVGGPAVGRAEAGKTTLACGYVIEAVPPDELKAKLAAQASPAAGP